jgi:hypothetical protein
MTRLPAVAFVAVTLSACNAGDRGAATLRWRIVDQTTGQIYNPEDVGIGGACACAFDVCKQACPNEWLVHAVRLVIADPSTGQEIGGVPDRDIVFPCHIGEATTGYDIPVGNFALSLKAYDPSNPSAPPEGVTPPPTIRQINKGELLNLDVIAIAINAPPVPTGAPQDGGVTD